MNVLVACEESQTVCAAFRRGGHNAYSCDIQECSGGHQEWHILGDVLPLLNGRCTFKTMDGTQHIMPGKWDLIIAHPPCTDLCVSGARWFTEKQRDMRQQKACVFFMYFALADCEHIAIENPVGIMSTVYRKPDQIIQPYEYGHPTKKATCLWLKGLPPLTATEIVVPELIEYHYKNGKIKKYGKGIDAARNENGRMYNYSDPITAKMRSKTFQGIADAMAAQWGDLNRQATVFDYMDEESINA